MTLACLIISYARKDNVLRLVEEAAKAGIDNIYVSLDGPRNSDVRDIQSDLKSDLAKSQSGLLGRIWIWQRETNLGSGASMIVSLDWAFANEEEVIILEDDLQVQGNFFNFMKFGLGEMKNHANLKIVTGTNPFPGVMNSRFGKLHYPVSWGWATNRLNWFQLRNLLFIEAPTRPPRFRLQRNLYWQLGKKRALLGQIEAWDVPLASEMYKTEFYTLIPPSNLVCNIGFDKHAAHTKEDTWPLNLSISDYSVPKKQKLDPSLLLDLEKEFEKKIFKIRIRHIISWIIHKPIDKFRFKSDTKKLLDRTLMETFPSK